MKNLNLILSLCACLLMGLSFNSCEVVDSIVTSDLRADATCQNNGTCDEGVCDCPDGFSGTNCEIEDLCITNPIVCENGGTANADCTACDCAVGYSGDNCETHCSENIIGTYQVIGGGTSFCITDKFIFTQGATSTSVKLNLLFTDGANFETEITSFGENCTTLTYKETAGVGWTGTITFDGNKLTDVQSVGCTFVAEKQ